LYLEGEIMPFPAWVEVDLDRLQQNIKAIKEWIGPSVKILLVVKADAYGHGAGEVSKAAWEAGADMLGVATVHEGLEVRQAGVDAPILVLSPALASEVENIVASDLRTTVCTMEFARALSEHSVDSGVVSNVHVEVDTGMGRSGVDHEDAVGFVKDVASLPGISLEGLFTHFPNCDGKDLDFERRQLGLLDRVAAELRAGGVKIPLLHAANSAALSALRESHLDMVRPGLLAYGVHPPGVARPVPVEPVMSFCSRLVQVRTVPAGRGISYGSTFVAKRPTRVGVVPVGYGHGYSSLLSNRGEVVVRGRRTPVIGRVTMDMTMVDLTNVPEAGLNDLVVLFGNPDTCGVGVEEVAATAGLLPYEVMCTIGKRVVRKYMKHHATHKVLTLVGEVEDTVHTFAGRHEALRSVGGS
jgi:alanine racemase